MIDPWYIEHKSKIFFVIFILAILRFALVDWRHIQRNSRPFTDQELSQIKERNRQEFADIKTKEATRAPVTSAAGGHFADRGAAMVYWSIRPGVMVRWRQMGFLNPTVSEKLKSYFNKSCLSSSEPPDHKACPHWIKLPANLLQFFNCPKGSPTPGDSVEGMRFLRWNENLALICEPSAACDQLNGSFVLKIEVLDRQPKALAQLTDLVATRAECNANPKGVTPIARAYVVSTPVN